MGGSTGENVMSEQFNFNFTKDKLEKIIPGNKYVVNWYNALYAILPEYEITTIPRVSAFLAQTAHESMNFTALSENLNYSAKGLMKTWPSRFPSVAIANQYAHKPQNIANKVYANRMGNGPESSGDGWKFRGRGLIQLTGKENYTWFAESIESDVNNMPTYLETFEGAVQAAAWFFETNNLNHYADINDFDGVSDIINKGRKTPKIGDSIGYADRLNKFIKIKKILNG